MEIQQQQNFKELQKTPQIGANKAGSAEFDQSGASKQEGKPI